MKQKSVPVEAPVEEVLKDIRRQTRRHYSAEDKIYIVLEGIRGEDRRLRLGRFVASGSTINMGGNVHF